jgi:transposase
MKTKQSIPKHLRYTMKDFDNAFPSDAACLEYIKEKRYPGGITECKKCGVERKHHRIGNRTAYSCDYCGTHIFPLVGTIFEKSSTSLRTWFQAMYLMSSTRCGISAKQIQRETGVTYKTAWRIFRQIRSLLSDGEDMKLEGPTVEIDEMYFGGVQKFNRGRMPSNKIPVVAIVQRHGKVIAKVVPTVNQQSINAIVKKHVVPGSVIYTDESGVYRRVGFLCDKSGKPYGFRHRTVQHKTEFVHGNIHTNSVEGLWSLIKRGIGGVYHSVSPKYLQTYLNEYTFRYNRRFEGNLQFKSVLERACEQV